MFDLAAIYRSMLAGKRALIILDNAGSEEQVKHLIAGDKTGFIITSRNALALDGVRSLRIDVFSEKKALDLLRVIVGKGIEYGIAQGRGIVRTFALGAAGGRRFPASQGRMDCA